jgi:hypothetical protein
VNLRNAASKCLAKIIKYQHHMPAREEVIDFIMKQLARGNSFASRRTYIMFCRHVISMIPFNMFKELFSVQLLSMQTDKIPRIRQDLLEVLIVIKPYYDKTEEEAYIITELL